MRRSRRRRARERRARSRTDSQGVFIEHPTTAAGAPDSADPGKLRRQRIGERRGEATLLAPSTGRERPAGSATTPRYPRARVAPLVEDLERAGHPDRVAVAADDAALAQRRDDLAQLVALHAHVTDHGGHPLLALVRLQRTVGGDAEAPGAAAEEILAPGALDLLARVAQRAEVGTVDGSEQVAHAQGDGQLHRIGVGCLAAVGDDELGAAPLREIREDHLVDGVAERVTVGREEDVGVLRAQRHQRVGETGAVGQRNVPVDGVGEARHHGIPARLRFLRQAGGSCAPVPRSPPRRRAPPASR